MNYNSLSLKRHQNAAKKAVFSKTVHTDYVANFAPLWQAGAVAGAGLGTLAGGLSQNEDGSQMDPATRLMNVGLSAGGIGLLGAAAGAGIPQLIEENENARGVARDVYRKTGVAVDGNRFPERTADRIRRERAIAKRNRTRIIDRVQDFFDPLTGQIEIRTEDAKNIASKAGEIAGNITRPITAPIVDAFSPNLQVLAERRRLRKVRDQAISERTREMMAAETNARLQSPEYLEEVDRVAKAGVDQYKSKVLDERSIAQKGTDAAKKVAGVVADTATNVDQAGRQVVEAVKNAPYKTIADKALDIGRKAAAAPYNLGKRFGIFSYMNTTAEFSTPYMTGAATGAVVGSGLGAGLGLASGINNARALEENQLNQIQAIQDPYARKKEWDIYDSDLSRIGRGLGNTTQTLGNSLTTAGVGAAGGALLGGAVLTGYHNLRKGKFDGFGRPTPSRLDGLRIALTGR